MVWYKPKQNIKYVLNFLEVELRSPGAYLSNKPPGGGGEVSRGEPVDEKLQLLQGTLSDLLHTNWV